MGMYRKWAGREYSLGTRVVVLGLLGILFLGLFPLLLVRGGRKLDSRLRLRRVSPEAASRVAGVGLIATGAVFAMSSIRAQVDLGSGTPLPMMPTQRLVMVPPFTWCRNPMTLGTVLGYTGVALLASSRSAVGIVGLVGASLLSYVRFVEEKELADRFGAEYLEYKRTTPFLIPRIRPRLSDLELSLMSGQRRRCRVCWE